MMFKKVPLFRVAQLQPGETCSVNVMGRDLALFNVRGAYYALGGACPHIGADSGEGFLDGDEVVCTAHNWRYSVATGRGGAGEKIATPYRVAVEGGWVKIEMPVDDSAG